MEFKPHIWKLTFKPCIFIIMVSLAAQIAGNGIASIPESKKFGFIGDFLKVEEIEGFPNSVDFFQNHIFQSRPLIMRGAAKVSPAFQDWKDDDYFLNLELPEDEYLRVETSKKENRTQVMLELTFGEFLKTYKQQEIYMVSQLPQYLSKDVIIPRPLQCPHIYKNSVVAMVMWFSSGGTKSVVHTDSVDNMHCLYDGEKHLIMVDPHRYADMVFFDHPESAYSDIDVDAVDYEKYPDLLSVEYYHVHLKAGDCLFIPYRWIHQVRSDGPRNIAVNIWWDTFQSNRFDLAECSPVADPNLTLDKVEFITYDESVEFVGAVKDQFLADTRHTKLTIEKYIYFNLKLVDKNDVSYEECATILKQIFKILDKDVDGIISHEEVKHLEDKDWLEVQNQLHRVNEILQPADEENTEQLDEKEDHKSDAQRNLDEL